MNQAEFISTLGSLRPSSTFLMLHKYESAKAEVADFIICFHMSYENVLLKSLKIAEEYLPTEDIDLIAQREIIISIKKSLKTLAETPIAEIDDAYQRFFNDDGTENKGVKLHRENNELHIFGLLHQKRVIVPGVYKKVNSSELTLAKKKLEKLLPKSRFRQFKIVPGQLEKIVVEKLELLPPEEA